MAREAKRVKKKVSKNIAAGVAMAARRQTNARKAQKVGTIPQTTN